MTGLKGAKNRREGGIGAVVRFTQMCKPHLPHAATARAGERGCRRLRIGQVAAPAGDAGLEVPRIRAIPEFVEIVVGLDYQQVGAGHPLDVALAQGPHVHCNRDCRAIVLDRQADGIRGVVDDRARNDLDIADALWLTGPQISPIHGPISFHLPGQVLVRPRSRVERRVQCGRDCQRVAGVILVLVGQNDRVERPSP